MSLPLNSALQMAENTPKARALRKEDAGFMNRPDWLWPHLPHSYGQKQVREIKIYRDTPAPYASVWFTHGTWWGVGGRTYGELMQDVADLIEQETGLAWRKGPR